MRVVPIAAAVMCSGVAAATPVAPLAVVPSPPQNAPGVASVLYLNRCDGGCTITRGSDDARAHRSSLPDRPGPFVLDELAWDDAAWAAALHCVREVYSPYAVTITDEAPAAGVVYNEVIVAGTPQQLGMSGIAGIALLAGDCSPYSNVLAFVFANAAATRDPTWLCYAIAQEAGHAAGLDHVFAFTDGTSGCRDPMSYRTDCGGQRFFRSASALCGESGQRPCRCGGLQSSHQHLLEVYGAGTPITGPPEVAILSPLPGGRMPNTVAVAAHAQRGVETLELWLNGRRWASGPGGAWGPDGQLETASIDVPLDVPDGVIDLTVIALDDLGVGAASTVTVTKGRPCESAATCAVGQRCEAGRCFWDPPVGEFGDACTYGAYCKSDVCVDSVCSQTCSTEDAGSCPDGFTCVYGSPDDVCRPSEGGAAGCCGASPASTPAAGAGLALLAFALSRARRACARAISRARRDRYRRRRP